VYEDLPAAGGRVEIDLRPHTERFDLAFTVIAFFSGLGGGRAAMRALGPEGEMMSEVLDVFDGNNALVFEFNPDKGPLRSASIDLPEGYGFVSAMLFGYG
jgi:hypothetical protein